MNRVFFVTNRIMYLVILAAIIFLFYHLFFRPPVELAQVKIHIDKVVIHSQATGKIAGIYAKNGQFVEKGQLIVNMSNEQYEKHLDTEKGNLRFLEALTPKHTADAIRSTFKDTFLPPHLVDEYEHLQKVEFNAHEALEEASMELARSQLVLDSLRSRGKSFGRVKNLANEMDKAERERDEAELSLSEAKHAYTIASQARARMGKLIEQSRLVREEQKLEKITQEQQEALYRSQLLKTIAAQEKLDATSAHAPDFGWVFLPIYAPGSSVHEGDLLFTLIPEESRPIIYGGISQRQAEYIKEGSLCNLSLDSDKLHFTGKVTHISPCLSKENTNIENYENYKQYSMCVRVELLDDKVEEHLRQLILFNPEPLSVSASVKR